MASREINEKAMIDEAEYSLLGRINSCTSVEPAYFLSVSPEGFETKIACIFILAEFPDTAMITLYTLSVLESEAKNSYT